MVALAVAILLLLSGSPRERTSHELADTEHTIGGQPTTCTELFGETCSFALQSDYNQWGQNLELRQCRDSRSLCPQHRLRGGGKAELAGMRGQRNRWSDDS
ncbi:hypothetical protein GCM10020255_035850 [Rhodococcus baikonurensis]